MSAVGRFWWGGALLALGAAVAAPTYGAVGRTEGSYGVSAGGEATYTIPIFAPPGSKGMAPQLALSYSHRSPGILFGEGWNLSGLSEISVCPKTWAQDGLSRGVRLDGTDRFCLDGEQLKLDVGSAAYGTNGAVYRTEIESYARVVSVGIAGNTPSYFSVERKDGLIYYYGSRADSRIESLGSTTAHTWALTTVVDRTGNRIEFDYNEDATNGSFQLTAVRYTTNAGAGVSTPAYQIAIVYENQPADGPGGNPDEIESGYLAGAIVRDVKRATQINVTYNGTLVRRYSLAYQGALSNTGNSRLASVTECGGSAGTDCLTPLTFTYQDGTIGLAASSTVSASTPVPSYAMALDVNGDGKTDLVYSSSATSGAGTWMVAFANGSGGYGTPVNTGISNVGFDRAVPIDFNADGRDDFLVPYSGGTWWVILGTTSGLATPTNTSANAWATSGNSKALDINGDGLEDLVDGHGTAIWYWQRNLAGTFDAWQYVVNPVASGTSIVTPIFPDRGMKRRTRSPDFNGDGHGDFLVTFDTPYYDNFLGTWISMWSTEARLGGTGSSLFIGPLYAQNVVYADLNGDRNTDIAYQAGSVWFYHLSTGTSLVGPFTGPSASGQDTALAIVMDWDGNGTEDIVAPHSDGYWRVMRSTGDNTFNTVENPGLYFGNVGATFAGDVNGDSLDDLIYTSAAGTFCFHAHLGVKPDLLKTITDGYGNVVTFDYVTLAQNNYSKYSDAVFPYMDYQGGLTVVSRATLPDGILGTYTMDYWYWGAHLHRQGRGFAGFYAMRPYDSRSGVSVTTYNQRSFPQTGRPFWVDTYTSGGLFLQRRIITNTQQTLGSAGIEQRYWAYTSAESVYDYETAGVYNGVMLRTTDTTVLGTDLTSGTITDSSSTITELSGANGLSPGRTHTRRTWTSSLMNDLPNWCLGKAQTVQQINSHSGYGGSSVTRTVGASWSGAYCRPTSTFVEPGNGTWQIQTDLEYDLFGNVKKETVTGAGMTPRISQTDYGTTGQLPIYATNALNQVAGQTWNYGLGVPWTQTDPNLVQVSYLYDNFGRKTRENRPDGTWTTFDWYLCTGCDPRVKLYVVQTDYATNSTSIGQSVRYLDTEDREIYTYRWVSALSDYTRVTRGFDSRGRLAYEYFPFTGSTSTYQTGFTYDVLNRKTIENRVISSVNSAQQYEYTYYEGLTIRQVDAENHQRTTVSDASGKTVKSSDPNSYATLFDFDAFGQPIRVMDSAGNTLQTIAQSTAYNLRGYKTSTTDIDMGTWGYSPNALGETGSQTDANGQTTTFGFDLLGRLTSRVEPNSGGSLTKTFVYGTSAALHEIGKLKYQQVSGTGVSTYTETPYYDSLGRPIQVAYNDGATNYYVDRAYNGTTGLLETIEYPTSYPTSGATRLKVKYEYAGSDLIRAKDFNAGTVFWQANSFDPRLNVTDETLGNGLKTVRGVDLVTGLLGSIQTGPGGGSTVQNLSYQWDKVGNLTQRADAIQGLTEGFGYDPLDRLTSATRNGATNLTVGYNNYGNITSKADQGGTSYTYTYHASKIHAVASTTSGLSFSYDANGNITTRTGSSVTWYANNLPKTINNGSDSSTFEYGPSGQYWKQAAAYGSGPETTTYIGGLWEKVAGTSVTAYRNYVKVGGRTVAIPTYRSTGVNDTYYPLSDHLGSTESVTNASAALIVKESFDAFGKRRGSNWTGAPTSAENIAIANTTRRGFTGHTMLDNVGLVHMNGRVYDPTIGRFLSADPNIDGPLDTQGWNRYSYVKNNPLSYTDPTGYFSLKKFFKSLVKKAVVQLVRVGLNFVAPGLGDIAYNAYNLSQAVRNRDVIGTITAVAGLRTSVTQFGRPAPAFNLSGASAAGGRPSIGCYVACGEGTGGRLAGIARSTGAMILNANGDADGPVQEIVITASRPWWTRAWSGAQSLWNDPDALLAASTILSVFSDGMMQGRGSGVHMLPIAPNGRFYSVAHEVRLPSSALGRSRGTQARYANAALEAQMQADPRFAADMELLIPGVGASISPVGGRQTPSLWIWHHDQPQGTLQLVPEFQHRPGSIYSDALHPGGKGGYADWAIPNGAPPNR